MLKYELFTALKSKRVVFLFLLFILITGYDLYQNYTYSFHRYLTGEWTSKPTGKDIFHPCFASFISASHIGRLPQILMKWAFPLYPLFAYADSFALQKQCGYYNILLTKIERKKVVSSRLVVAFLVPFLAIFVALVLNFIGANIVFKGGTDFSGWEKCDLTNFQTFSLSHPYGIYVAYIFVFSFIMGLYGMFCAAVTFFIPKYIVLYPVIFFVWFLIMNIPYSIWSLMHSFTDYSSTEMIVSSIYYTVFMLATAVAAYIYKVRYDEL